MKAVVEYLKALFYFFGMSAAIFSGILILYSIGEMKLKSEKMHTQTESNYREIRLNRAELYFDKQRDDSLIKVIKENNDLLKTLINGSDSKRK